MNRWDGMRAASVQAQGHAAGAKGFAQRCRWAAATAVLAAAAVSLAPAPGAAQVVLGTAAAPAHPPRAGAPAQAAGGASPAAAGGASPAPAAAAANATLAPAAPPLAARPAGQPFAPPAREAAMAGEIDARRMMQTVHALVAFGPRMGGTPSGEHAAAYLAAAFKAAGAAVEVVDDPPHAAHWEDGWTVELEPGGKLASAWPYGFSPSLEPATAPLAVQSGDATAKHADWRGKVLYVPGPIDKVYAPIAGAADRPLAILTSAPGDGKRYLDSAYLQALPQVPGARVVDGVSARPVPVFGISWQDAQRLTAAGGAARVHVALRSTVRRAQPRTVIATVPGRDNQHYFLICAHGDSDSGGPGADDNGSGEAVVLELARVYAQLIRDGKLPQPQVALRFAVWGSEYASSGAYVAREGKRLGDCLGVLNLDEVGTGAERDALYFESNEIPWNRTLLGTLNQVGADYVGRAGYWSEYTTNPSQGGTDSYAFLPQSFQGELPDEGSPKVPATTVYTAAWDKPGHLQQTAGWESPGTPDPKNLTIDYSRYYHSSGDVPENTTDRKPQAMVAAARALGIALVRLAFPAG